MRVKINSRFTAAQSEALKAAVGFSKKVDERLKGRGGGVVTLTAQK
jgi:hypothetical protein